MCLRGWGGVGQWKVHTRRSFGEQLRSSLCFFSQEASRSSVLFFPWEPLCVCPYTWPEDLIQSQVWGIQAGRWIRGELWRRSLPAPWLKDVSLARLGGGGWAGHSTHTHVSWGGFRTNERQKDRTKERREDKRQADRQADREERQKERKNHDRHKSSKTHRKEGFPVGTSRIVQNRSQQFPGHPPLFIHASVPACLSRGRRLS